MESSRNSNTQPDSTNSLQTGEYNWPNDGVTGYDADRIYASNTQDLDLDAQAEIPNADLPQGPIDPTTPAD